MEIFGHLIKNESIVGIGPVLQEQYPDINRVVMEGTCRYQFELHLAGHTVRIFSPWFNAKNDEAQMVCMRKWKEQYFLHRKDVADLLACGVTIPASKISAQ